MKVIGLDPGLRHTGWGIVSSNGSALKYVASGVLSPPAKLTLAKRLSVLCQELEEIIESFQPDQAAIEETFVNMNPASTLKLGAARGVVMMVPARLGLNVSEYSANKIKKSIVGAGHAHKQQIIDMVGRLLPTAQIKREDEADALAVAICHAHHRPATMQAIA